MHSYHNKTERKLLKVGLDKFSLAMSTKAEIHKSDDIKLKRFCTAKKIIV
jgi:hypothetical protein